MSEAQQPAIDAFIGTAVGKAVNLAVRLAQRAVQPPSERTADRVAERSAEWSGRVSSVSATYDIVVISLLVYVNWSVVKLSGTVVRTGKRW